MARKRMVSPELLTSLTVQSLPIRARYGFVALWMYVDDAGRGIDDARLLRAHTWPLDDISTKAVGTDLDKMAAAGLVCRYTCGTKPLLHLPSWHEWQKPQHPTPSRSCPCPRHEPDITRLFHEDSSNAHEGYTSGSVILTPNVVEGSSDQSKVVEGNTGEPTCRHQVSSAECFVCKQHQARAAVAS
jgi:hypothetical protein